MSHLTALFAPSAFHPSNHPIECDVRLLLSFSFSVSHRGLGLQSHHKLVTFGVDELLAQVQEGEGCYSDDQGKVEPAQ